MRIIQTIIDFHNRDDLKNNLLYQGFKKFEILAITAAIVGAVAYAILGASYLMPTVIKYSFVAIKCSLTVSASLLALFFLSQAASWLGAKVNGRLAPLKT